MEYNNYDDTVKCIESVLTSDYEHFETILFDNDSEKKVSEKLKIYCKKKKNIHFIQPPKNGGYGYGNNVGIHYATKFNPEYFLILSNDTLIE